MTILPISNTTAPCDFIEEVYHTTKPEELDSSVGYYDLEEAIKNQNYGRAIEIIDQLMYPGDLFGNSFLIEQKIVCLALDGQLDAAADLCKELQSCLRSAQEKENTSGYIKNRLRELNLLQALFLLRTDEQAAMDLLLKDKPVNDIIFLRALEKKLNIKSTPENPPKPWDRNEEPIYSRVNYLWEKEYFAELLDLLQNELEKAPLNGEPNFQSYMAISLALLDRYEEALEIYETIPDQSQLDEPNALEIILFMKGDYEKAKELAQNNLYAPLLLAIQWIENRQ